MKVKGEYYHERLTPEPLKLLGSAENNTNKDKTGQKQPHFETTELLLIVSSIKLY